MERVGKVKVGQVGSPGQKRGCPCKRGEPQQKGGAPAEPGSPLGAAGAGRSRGRAAAVQSRPPHVSIRGGSGSCRVCSRVLGSDTAVPPRPRLRQASCRSRFAPRWDPVRLSSPSGGVLPTRSRWTPGSGPCGRLMCACRALGRGEERGRRAWGGPARGSEPPPHGGSVGLAKPGPAADWDYYYFF